MDLKVLKLSTGLDELSMELLPKVFQDVNRSLQKLVLCTLNPHNTYYVCFDQLDIGFQPTSNEYKQRLIGLILAARDFANSAREAGKNLKVLVFLRSDIYYNSLLFEDKNKITDTYGIEIEWESQAQSPSLKSVMERRIGEVLSIPVEGSWDTIFDETQEMRGHQTKYQHIVDRTFRRPRDVIKFCNSILQIYKNRRLREEETPDKFVNEDINLSRPDYSNYLRDEIIDEIHKYFPGYRFYFEILKQIGYQQFSIEDFLEAFELWKDRFDGILQPMDVLEHLYDFSIIGFYRAGGSGYGGSEYVYKYLDQRAEFNRFSERFRVHWGLVETLGLKQYSRSS